MAVAPKSIAILYTPLITFQPFIHWQWFYNKIIWGEYSNCHQTIILGLYIFLDHILSRTIDQKFWWSTPTTLTLPCPPPFCHSFFLFLGLSVFSSFCLSVFPSFRLSVFPSFRLSDHFHHISYCSQQQPNEKRCWPRSSSANQVSQVSSVGKRLVFNVSFEMSDQMIHLTKFAVALFALSTVWVLRCLIK